MQQPEFQRGVENPQIIDLIASDPESREVVLVVIERRPWGSVPNQLQQFDEKLNRYMTYVLDNFLVKQYPQYEGVPVRIQINCAERPTEEHVLRFLEGVGMVCEQNGLNFAVKVKEDGI